MPTEKARAQRSLLQRARQKFFKWIRQLGSQQNDNGGNGGEAQLDEECAKVFAMDTDSMGFDFHDRPSKSMKRNRQQQQQPQQPPAPQCQSSAGGGGGGVTSPPSERSANGEARTAPAPPIPLPPPLDNPLSEELTSPPKSGAESDTGPLNSLTLQEESDGDGNSSGSEYVLSDPCTYLTKIEYQEEEDFSPTRKVSFLNNENIDQFDVDGLKNKKRRRHHHHHGYHFKFRKYSLPDDPTKKRLYNEKVLPTSNNNNRVRRVRHKATRPSNTSLMHIGKGAELHPSLKKLYDHSPHAIFVELAELTKSDNVKEEKEWKETARWIKYEEDVEEGVDRWGKPHVASLSFHSLLNLRRCLEEGLNLYEAEKRKISFTIDSSIKNGDAASDTLLKHADNHTLPNIDYHEVGRSISTLMANQQFHSIAYRAESRKELLSAINEFLDDSIVLPPGDWERQALLPIEEIKAKSEAIRIRKENAIKKAQEAQGISDITDSFNAQCVAAAIFMYFAAVSGAIAFGGLTGNKTENLIGISETLLCTSIGGIIFAILAAQPL
ncbi:unnamed protein product, partial [Callosobruchus maculatus]